MNEAIPVGLYVYLIPVGARVPDMSQAVMTLSGPEPSMAQFARLLPRLVRFIYNPGTGIVQGGVTLPDRSTRMVAIMRSPPGGVAPGVVQGATGGAFGIAPVEFDVLFERHLSLLYEPDKAQYGGIRADGLRYYVLKDEGLIYDYGPTHKKALPRLARSMFLLPSSKELTPR